MESFFDFNKRLSLNVCHPRQATDFHSIVLAAGNGKRMEDFIFQYYGSNHPKQFIAFTGKRSMVQQTLWRTEKLTPREKILVVVDPKHHHIIKEQLNDRPQGTLIFQPMNRETAPGILLPLSYIYKENPDSTVAVFPSDHFILQEDRFMEYVALAKWVSQLYPDKIVLLGMEPNTPEGEYGWIQPGSSIPELDGFGVHSVVRFHEKPDPLSAARFYKNRYLWNTLVMVTQCSTLWKIAKEILPHTHRHFEKIVKVLKTPEEQNFIQREYEVMEPANISHHILEKSPSQLLVINVRDVFWSDWGNGNRVLETLRKIGRIPRAPMKYSKEENNMAFA